MQSLYQLDIFADSVSVQRANDLIAELSSFDHITSRQALCHLVEVDPNHTGLPQFQVLCDFVDHWVDSRNDPDWPRTPSAVAEEEQLIREQIIPAAAVMGNAGGDLVRNCWGILAKASEGAGVTPDHCDFFAAELYLRGKQFHDVVRTAQRVPGKEMRAAVQRWLRLGIMAVGSQNKPGAQCCVTPG